MTNQELDTFDTLKYGHIPVENLLDYAEQKLNMVNLKDKFTDDFGDFSYSRHIELLWDGDFYDLGISIMPPDLFEEREHTEVMFWLVRNISDEEQRTFPDVNNINYSIEIKTREQFIDALLKWKLFVGECYLEILRNRLEILEDLDTIVKSEKQLKSHTDSEAQIKLNYYHWLSMIPLKLSMVVEELLNFENTGESIN